MTLKTKDLKFYCYFATFYCSLGTSGHLYLLFYLLYYSAFVKLHLFILT